jgi:hypothetical protein
MTGGQRRFRAWGAVCAAGVALLAVGTLAEEAAWGSARVSAFAARGSDARPGAIMTSADDIVTARAVDRRRGLV